MYKQILPLFFIVVVGIIFSCKSKIKTSTQPNDNFVKGADVSWLPQMEAFGFTFYETDNTESDCLVLLKKRGINTIRLRVFVHPSNDPINGHCSLQETVQMATRAKNLGLNVLIDFHYSDSWADPSKQTKPALWANCNFSDLKDSVFQHTHDVLTALKQNGVTPKWVQIGNEIPSGLLWPEGNYTNFGQLSALINKGYDATKAIDSTIKVIVHLDKGNDNARFRWFFDLAIANGMKFDIIGASYYPYWLGTDYTTTITDLKNNLNDMVVRYNKDVMIVEVGGDFTMVQNTKDMLEAVIKLVREIPNNRGLGVLYWEPEGVKSWSNYQLNCWKENGMPSEALNAFLN